jgi:hypothetical protein
VCGNLAIASSSFASSDNPAQPSQSSTQTYGGENSSSSAETAPIPSGTGGAGGNVVPKDKLGGLEIIGIVVGIVAIALMVLIALWQTREGSKIRKLLESSTLVLKPSSRGGHSEYNLSL